MRLRVSDRAYVSDLHQHFERSGFAVQQLSEDTIDVTSSDAPSEEQAEREVSAHLAVWRVLYPHVKAERAT